ncbi:MAG: toll/interleukin-1 receptor domain-containing protein, partial [Pseudomonadota bacterium]
MLVPTSERLKVFISYSRAQVGFADELELALSDKQHEVLIDRHSIAKGEAFKQRLGEMILACDTVVFILSDESATSQICAWEISEAARLLKRVLVVTIADLSDGVVVPQALASIDWIHCWNNPKVPGSNQTKGFIELDRALRTDLAWLRERTRLQEQAVRWAGRSDDLNRESSLLRAELLSEAIDWQASKPVHESIPDIVLDFLSSSRDAEERRRSEEAANLAERESIIEQSRVAMEEREVALKRLSRRSVMGVGVAGALTAGASGLALWANDAENRFRRAQTAAALAREQAIEDSITEQALNTNISGQITAYASSPGVIASDGPPGENSPYT